MLLADLRKAIEDMEEIRSLEQDSQDSQNQSRIDHLYAKIGRASCRERVFSTV